MLIVGHAGGVVGPDEWWSAWSTEPLAWMAVLAGLCVVPAGRHPARRRAFLAALLVLAIALVSPLDAMSASLAAAHMAQHLVLVMVAAPLLALARPGLLGRVPRGLHPVLGRILRRPAIRMVRRRARDPVATAVGATAVLWAWHVPQLYDAAVQHRAVHVIEHVTLLLSAWLGWRAVVLAERRRHRRGTTVLVLFGMTVQSGALGFLLTFSGAAWYGAYADTAGAWGLSPVEDQRLAGLLMWIPGGAVYLAAALWSVGRSVAAAEAAGSPRPGLRNSLHGVDGAEPAGVGGPGRVRDV